MDTETTPAPRSGDSSVPAEHSAPVGGKRSSASAASSGASAASSAPAPAADASSGAACGCTCPGETAPTMAELMVRSPIPKGICDWVACMRKAGISLTYSLEKRHIPDMSKPDDPTPSASDTTSTAAPVGNMDTMTTSGTCRIRYFDLILGSLGILAACTMIKCACCLKRW